jgi:uncharacterized membrane protein
MVWLIAGLVLFFASHSVRIFADGWRSAFIAQRGEGAWKGLYSVIALAGLVMVGHGYGQVHGAPLYTLPPHLAHLTFALVWLGFILVVAGNWPGNHIQHLVGHPMVAGVGLWALGHLLVNATPQALALFGTFLAWAVVDFVSLRSRPPTKPALTPKTINTVLVVVTGTLLGGVFAHVLHVWLIGVSPFAAG